MGQRRYLVNIHEAMAEYEAGTSSIVSASAHQELQDALAHCHQILGSADDFHAFLKESVEKNFLRNFVSPPQS